MSLVSTIRAMLGDETAAAERRWTAINKAKRAAGCQCGKPATEVRYFGGNTGSVPVEFWTCTEHVGVTAWSGNPDAMTPLWPRVTRCAGCPIGGACSSSTRNGEEPYEYHCPERTPAEACAEGFQWIGQSLRTCEGCGQPAWEHAGWAEGAEDSPFSGTLKLRPWMPGEREAIEARWKP